MFYTSQKKQIDHGTKRQADRSAPVLFHTSTTNHLSVAGAARVQRKANCVCGGGCPRCKDHKAANPEIEISSPLDRYEREADAVADQVMKMPDPDFQSEVGSSGSIKATLQRKCAGCEGDGQVPGGDSTNISMGGGQPLADSERAFFEPRFGRDFSAVRLHTDEKAAESALALNALAYTIGSDVVFGANQYSPTTSAGRNLLAHELAHVVQQRGPSSAPRVQARVVDDDDHLPCRATEGRSAADLTARENRAAEFAERAAAALRATPISENTRSGLWRWFRLDYNNPLDRCRRVATIGDRFDLLARDLRQTACTYRCTATGEPEGLCTGGNANAATYVGFSRRIDLCAAFWLRNPEEQSETLLHEWAHYLFIRRGVGDELAGGFDNAACYGAFATEIVTGSPISPDDENCPPNLDPLPARNDRGIDAPCPTNVFATLSAGGGYLYGLPGARSYGTVTGGLDLNFPLTRMHDWELTVGGRFTGALPAEPNQRAAYLIGLRTGLLFRYRPWRFGGQGGGYAEIGGANLPNAATGGSNTYPYLSGGLTGGLNFPIGRQTALQLFLDIGGGAGLNTTDNKLFGWFHGGLGAAIQFQ